MMNISIFTALAAVAAGTVFGFKLRALKLSASFGMSLLLPLCFALKPETALFMLMAIYCGAYVKYPSNVKKYMTDFCILTVLALSFIFIIPILAKIALKIDRVQFLALSVFCITLAIYFQASSIQLPGWNNKRARLLSLFLSIMSAMTGLMIPTIGIDVGTGAQRYSMGITELFGGIDFIILVLGLCCLAEILHAVSGRGRQKGDCVTSSVKLLNICKLSEILPAVTFGIPCTQASAIIVGTFALYGIPQAEFMSGISVFALPAVIALSIIIQVMIKIVHEKINKELLSSVAFYPIFAAVAFVGAYSINYRLFDMFLLTFFGSMGFLMKRLNFPVMPLIVCAAFGSRMEWAYRAPFAWSLPVALFYLLSVIVLAVYIKKTLKPDSSGGAR